MTNQDLQAELKAKVKEGVKPSQLKRSSSTPIKSTTKPSISEQEETIKKLEQQKEALLKVNQEAVKQNEQLVKVIDQLKADKKNLAQEKNQLEEQLIAKRIELLKTPLTNSPTNSAEIQQLKEKLLFFTRLNQTKN